MKLLVFISLFLISNSIFGCSCSSESRELNANTLWKTDFIVKGIVVGIDTVIYNSGLNREVKIADKGLAAVGKLRVALKVSSYFKATDELKSDTIYVYTATDGAACGYYFALGNVYMVYGSQRARHLRDSGKIEMETTICSRTTLNAEYETILLRTWMEETIFDCHCPDKKAIPKIEDIEQVAFIVKGKVISIEKTLYNREIEEGVGLPILANKISLKVYSYFKTSEEFTSDTVSIYTPINKNLCGFDFLVGEVYLIYGKQQKTLSKDSKFIEMYTQLCSRSTSHFEVETMILRNLVEERFIK